MKPSCRYFPLMALSNSLRGRRELRTPSGSWFLGHLPSPVLPLHRQGEGGPRAERGCVYCGFPRKGGPSAASPSPRELPSLWHMRRAPTAVCP